MVGLAGGGAYALVALGIVAVYRGSGILNFSQGAIGMAASYVFWDLYKEGDGSLPVVPAVVIGVLVGTALGVAFYLLVVRFLHSSSEMAKVVATLGFMLLLQSAAVKIYGTQPHLLKPLFGDGKVTVFGAFMTYDTLAILLITIALGIGLTLLFRRTRLGMRATALWENPQAAAAIGVSPLPTGITTWALGGAMAAFGGILLIPITGLTPSTLTLLVIPAMAAALVGRFTGIWPTIGVGLALGVAESLMRKYEINSGVISSVPFAVIIVVVVLGGTALPGRGEVLLRRLPRVSAGRVKPVSLVVAAVVGLVIAGSSPTWGSAMINTTVFGLLALSVLVVTGYAGQISVACAALAGFGSFVAARASSDLHLPFLLCLLAGTLAAVLLGLLIGGPAVRVRGVNLAIITLGLSLAVENLILLQPSMTGGSDGMVVESPTLLGLDLNPSAYPSRYAVVCVVVLAIAAVAVLNVRRGESGRRYLAVRANERGAASVGVSVAGAKLGAFATSAALAGLAGALSAFRFTIADFTGYGVFNSITTLAFTVVGGVGFVAGAVFAAVTSQGGLFANFVSNVLDLTTIDAWLAIFSGLFVMDMMIRMPDGVILHMSSLKDRTGRLLASALPVGARARRDRPDTARAESGRAEPAAAEPDASKPAEAPVTLPHVSGVEPGSTVLAARDVRVTYGGIVAVKDVSLELAAGKVVGVVGPNGAGKTTLLDALTGFAPSALGAIELRGRDVGRLKAHARARLGMGRTFQNLELFDDLSVRENILTGLDGRGRAAYLRDLVRPRRGTLNEAARAAVVLLDLERDLDTVVADLPQGRRRMVAIARLVAQQPAVVLLDEPAAGLNGAERRTAGELFRALADQLGAAVLLVEHNIDVVAATCDHVIVLHNGEVLSSGPPAEVLREQAVRDAYLGRLTPAEQVPEPERH
ncbi:branched-chain amino acid ABC transporter permease/ATP-binding protein [Actinomadura physcomitrii]|uniref:branched-chain amino acid ABC transporter permease/ATP-binding protein n=1 Tax=Actinomadura physcomitrii TaxID=2650748 RepID=UPI0019247295|nr:branched-chain amino acid ABC transporter permease/ATP-binding protein [Actinomadura physcomitrii]